MTEVKKDICRCRKGKFSIWPKSLFSACKSSSGNYRQKVSDSKQPKTRNAPSKKEKSQQSVNEYKNLKKVASKYPKPRQMQAEQPKGLCFGFSTFRRLVAFFAIFFLFHRLFSYFPCRFGLLFFLSTHHFISIFHRFFAVSAIFCIFRPLQKSNKS